MKKILLFSFFLAFILLGVSSQKQIKAEAECRGNWVQIAHAPDYSYIIVECIADPYNPTACAPCMKRETWYLNGGGMNILSRQFNKTR